MYPSSDDESEEDEERPVINPFYSNAGPFLPMTGPRSNIPYDPEEIDRQLERFPLSLEEQVHDFESNVEMYGADGMPNEEVDDYSQQQPADEDNNGWAVSRSFGVFLGSDLC